MRNCNKKYGSADCSYCSMRQQDEEVSAKVEHIPYIWAWHLICKHSKIVT